MRSSVVLATVGTFSAEMVQKGLPDDLMQAAQSGLISILTGLLVAGVTKGVKWLFKRIRGGEAENVN